eukprot:GEMP01030300.1.p1 GENE.GEMP01030300.1~~GEMP01030300.1.p1  ORF type:complete len:327 (+),score=47.16 GEMP01030300.1:131-1111(+)
MASTASGYQSFGMTAAESLAASALTQSITSFASPTASGSGYGSGQSYWTMPKIPHEEASTVTASTRSLCPDSRRHGRHAPLNLGQMRPPRSRASLTESINRAVQQSTFTMASTDDDRHTKFVLGNPEDRFTQLNDPFSSALNRAKARARGGAYPRAHSQLRNQVGHLGYLTSGTFGDNRGNQDRVEYAGLATNLQYRLPDHQNFAHHHRFADHGGHTHNQQDDYDARSVQYFVTPGGSAPRRDPNTRPREKNRGQSAPRKPAGHTDRDRARDYGREGRDDVDPCQYVEDDYDHCQWVEVDAAKLRGNQRSASMNPFFRCLQLCTGA